MQAADFLSAHPELNFVAYLAFCLAAWGVSLFIYEKATPYREWELVGLGNKAAAWSMGGVALGLAMPLSVLALRSDVLGEMFLWSAISLGVQIGMWFIASKTFFAKLKASMEAGVESVGMVLGFFAACMGMMIAACIS